MIKISTLFKKNPENLARVINEINPENEWVFKGEGVATRKFDGTAAAIINGELYKRYDVKKGRQVPEGAIPCQNPDEITGHWPHWVKCDRNNKEDKYFFEAFDKILTVAIVEHSGNLFNHYDGTYELVGPKVQGNPEKFTSHHLIKHGSEIIPLIPELITFDNIMGFLMDEDIEGIVFHHPDGRMCKIRKSDFGIKRTSPNSYHTTGQKE